MADVVKINGYDIKDATARQMISELGNSLYWLGVTTTALTDGDTTNPITVGGESVTARTGAVAQYSGEEFAWNGSAWQSLDKNNFGSLAFKNSATGSYTPDGSVSISGGTLPTLTYDSSTESLTFSQGAFPSAGTFTGTQATITVS